MKAKKALTKLYKKANKKSPSASLQLLKQLKKNPDSSLNSTSHPSRGYSSSKEFQELAEQVAISAVSELAKPLSPVISWLNDAPVGFDISTSQRSAANTSSLSPVKPNQTLSNVSSIGRLPLKSPPCKRCPALQNGLCKCAAKKFQLSA